MALPAFAYTTIRPRRGGLTHATGRLGQTACGRVAAGWIVVPATRAGDPRPLGCKACRRRVFGVRR